MFNQKEDIYTLDLKIIVLVALLSVIFIVIPPLNETPLRIFYASILILFIPGYALIAALFPRKDEITAIERFTLSIGFSIIVVVFGGLVISLTRWLFNPNSIALSLFMLTCILVIIAHINRNSLDEEERFTIYAFIESKQEKSITPNENELIKTTNKRFIIKAKTKIKAIEKADITRLIDKKTQPELQKALLVGLFCSLIIVSVFFVHNNITREKDPFTALFILGPDGKAESYPNTLSVSQSTTMIVGIENYELTSTNYILQIKLDGKILEQIEISLENNEIWEQNVSIKPVEFKSGKQKLEFALYKGGATGRAYRSVHLWITQELDTEELPGSTTENIDFISITNPSMDLDTGWIFTTTNESIASSSYVDGAGIYSGRAYVINSTYQGTLPIINRHSISQEFRSDNEENVLLSVYLKDTYTKGTAGKDEVQFKQVLLNGAVVWTDGINGNEGWQRLQVPVKLREGTNTLTFTLMQNRNQLLEPVEMIIDEISFQPVSEVSPYLREDYTIEFDLPVSYVLPLAKSLSTENFMVSWNGTDIGSGIAYYNIDYSTDGTTWQRWLSGTTETTAQFNGKAGTTYYFRSMAVDNAQNKEPIHPLPDTSTTIDISRLELTLDITPNPTSESTNIIVESTRPLNEVTCNLNSQSFGVSDTLKMTTKDGGITWTGKYTLKVKDNFNVEIIGKDFSNNTAYVFGTIYSDTSLEKLVIQTYPEKTSGDVEIGITSSIALQDTPKITVRDRNGKLIEAEYKSLSGNEYRYSATINDTIADGVARITATAKTVDSQSLYEEDTFIIDRVKPTIQSNSPDNGATVSTDSPTIKASYSDDRAGIDRSSVVLRINGIDVTSSSDVSSSSILYTANGLDNGPATVTLSVSDQAGNTREKSWTFIVAA
jgi:uncharacterized membrane protein